MFVTGPPAAGERAGGGTRVCAAASRFFDGPTGLAPNPSLPGYVADMSAPFGLEVRTDLIEQGAGHSYGEMCLPLLADLVSEEQPADLLVLATAIPDVRLGRATATYLSWHCPGAPLGFAVCDQGMLAAFTALHLVDGYAHTGECRRAVLLVAEQPTLFHELPAPTPVPDRAAAVGMVLDAAGGGPSVRRHTEVREQDVAGVLAADMADHEPAVVLLGAHLAERAADVDGDVDIDGDVRGCEENQPFTGIWLELARGLPDLREKRVLLAEYDPTLRQLFSAAVRCG
jgi:4-hydroxymandelate oxidase